MGTTASRIVRPPLRESNITPDQSALLLASIELDATIQCRADIDIATVNDYAEAMQAGDVFPPVDVFGTEKKCWIGDGWHRVMAARSAGLTEIAATLHGGGRIDALKHALAANAAHGRRRTNKDKEQAVAIALREWPKKTDSEIADLCAVSHPFVGAMRRRLNPSICNGYTSETRTRRDGTDYTVRHEFPIIGKESEAATPAPAPADLPLPAPGPPRNGMQFAQMAVMDLEQIRADDLERGQAFAFVKEWIDEHQ